jgi:DNA-binding MarR family transcriptional regulator/N-acetylglutamate synthase-like GNAT family acetyltransferase
MAPCELEQRVAAARRFNRFYTRRIGVLHEGAYRSPFSLTEVRVLYELAHRDRPTATALGRDLGLDPGYLSRILRGFERRGLVLKTRSAADGRQSHLALTAQGRKVFAPLNARSHDEVAALLGGLSAAAQARVVGAMQTIERLLGDRAEPSSPASYLLRPLHPGDLGWVVHRHGALYAQEYGYDERFEALVADIVARFVQHYDPKRERCWIAEQNGEVVGSVFLVTHSKTVAQLRLLLVEPRARGSGIGSRLVSECVRFARQTGYRKLMLWTQSELRAARRLYEAAGFRLVRKERHSSFGQESVAETWELDL